MIGGAAAALAAATIWGLVIFLYKKHMEMFDPVTVNFSRLLYVAVFMAPVLALVESASGVWAAVASGLITLVLGDSLYFYAIHRVGGSVAAPLAYTYVVITQYFAYALGENVTYLLVVSSLLVVLGVGLLARGGETRINPLGLAAAAGAALMWSLGVTAIKLATMEGIHPLAVAYLRATSAAVVLGAYLAFRGRLKVVKSLKFAGASVLDLGVGSALFTFSIDVVGLALATILVSASPLIAQTYAKTSGVERLTSRQIVGGVVIFLAIALAVGPFAR